MIASYTLLSAIGRLDVKTLALDHAGLSAGSALPSGARRLARPAHAVGAVALTESSAPAGLRHDRRQDIYSLLAGHAENVHACRPSTARQRDPGGETHGQPQDPQAIERRTIAKVSWRLLPLVALAYCIAYIDRSNISFAALTMNKDLGFSAYIYGWGAGIFFFSYFLFEIPSNLILEKVGARIWIARIMITWGIISGLTAFVTGTTSFLIIRFLLGAAEAGFFPA